VDLLAVWQIDAWMFQGGCYLLNQTIDRNGDGVVACLR
jgi:hypothetical protein